MSEEETDSDYEVEQFVQPDHIRKPINDESADLLGNFDENKRREIFEGRDADLEYTENENGYAEESATDSDTDSESQKEAEEESDCNDDNGKDLKVGEQSSKGNKNNKGISKVQLTTLMRGASKANRFVLYVTNLSFESTKEVLQDYFNAVGTVKSVRIPQKRRGGFAFVEMADLDGYQRAFQLHDTELQGRRIKIQFSEAGKKKSANKKNIIKQKNRKLAQMRKEQKCFTKSGKFYDKSLKKEKEREAAARKRWRKKPATRNP